MIRLGLVAVVLAFGGVLAAPAVPSRHAPQLTCKYGFKYVVKIVHGHKKRVKVCKKKPPAKPQADLEVTMTGVPDQVTVGNHVAYTFTVENAGPAVAADVKIAIDLPPGRTDLYSYGGTPEGDTSCSVGQDATTNHIECNFGELAPETQVPDPTQSPYAFARVVVEPSAAGNRMVHAKVTTGTSDSHQENNQVSRALHVLPGPAAADLSVAVTPGPDATVPDGYEETIGVTNHGPTEATDVYVTLLLPQGSTMAVLPPFFDLLTGPPVPTGLCPAYVYSFLASSIVCFDSIASGETQSQTIRILPSIRSPATAQTDAVVSAYTRDPDLVDNRASATTAVAPFTPEPGPDIRLSLEPPPDAKTGQVAIPFRLENLGLGDLNGVNVSASVSPALANPTLDLVSASSATQCSSTDGSIGCLVESIESDSRQLGAVVGTAAAGTYTVTVTVTASNLATPVSDSATFQVK